MTRFGYPYARLRAWNDPHEHSINKIDHRGVWERIFVKNFSNSRSTISSRLIIYRTDVSTRFSRNLVEGSLTGCRASSANQRLL